MNLNNLQTISDAKKYLGMGMNPTLGIVVFASQLILSGKRLIYIK